MEDIRDIYKVKERGNDMFTATFANEDGEYEVQVQGESVETVGEFLCNCGEYGDDLLLSVEEVG
jgi:hypothetical protein